MDLPTVTIRDADGVLRSESEHLDPERGWDLPAGPYLLVPVAAGERSIHLSTVGGAWPYQVTGRLTEALGRYAAQRSGWWQGNVAGDLLDLLAKVVPGNG